MVHSSLAVALVSCWAELSGPEVSCPSLPKLGHTTLSLQVLPDLIALFATPQLPTHLEKDRMELYSAKGEIGPEGSESPTSDRTRNQVSQSICFQGLSTLRLNFSEGAKRLGPGKKVNVFYKTLEFAVYIKESNKESGLSEINNHFLFWLPLKYSVSPKPYQALRLLLGQRCK